MRQPHISSPAGPGREPRRGVALVGVVVVLAVVSAMMVSISWNIVANRRQAEHRRQEIQARALAASGIELAVAGLLGDADRYKGETFKPIPHAEVRITAEREEGARDVFRVVSEVRYPTDIPNNLKLSVERRLRRVTDGDQVRIEMLPAKNMKPGTE
jgi:type II secretory pathway pseudopilin PulG